MSTHGDRRDTIISADTHAGGSHAAYCDDLEERGGEEFDAWQGEYEIPFSDLGDQRRRLGQAPQHHPDDDRPIAVVGAGHAGRDPHALPSTAAVPAPVGRVRALPRTAVRPEHVLPRSSAEYVEQNVWFGVSFPPRAEVAAVRARLGLDHLMWGSDRPHDEGAFPLTTPALRQAFHGWPEADGRKVVTDDAAARYGFDTTALAASAAEVGPVVSEVARPLDKLPPDANEAILRNTRSPAA